MFGKAGTGMLTNMILALALVATSVAAALIALLLVSVLRSRQQPRPRIADTAPALEPTVFLFDDRTLVDATAPAWALLQATPVRGDEWSRLSAFLAPRFENFEARMGRLAEEVVIELAGSGDAPLRLRAEYHEGLARITLSDLASEGQAVLVDGMSQRALEDEVTSLRKAVDSAPILVWREDARGDIVWANRAYLLQSGALEAEDELTWPLPALFEAAPDAKAAPTVRRARIERNGKAPLWFDCHSLPAADGSLHYALPADTAVSAEISLREFVQTLTKTFAELPIGLAIFDRQRQLQLFNPALIDLTTLGADFLSARPTLFAFLDRLRDARMMPEPKDYSSWRQKMAELEKAAASGRFEETWALPSGQTYRVTGRPHPEGAVAFLIEDISSEVSLTRRFRSELELSQAVIDAMDEAIAVFSTAGVLILSNRGYAHLWGTDPGTTLGEVGIGEAMKTWEAQGNPDPVWAEARDFVTEIGPRASWEANAGLRDGRSVACRFVPLAGGATLAGFRAIGEAPARRDAPASRAGTAGQKARAAAV